MKIGRNEKCPCGSNKKYKHCCYKSEQINGNNDLSNQHGQTEEQYLGFNRERYPHESPFDINYDSLCCLVMTLTHPKAALLNEMHNTDAFVEGMAIVTSGKCSNTRMAGPFVSLEDAFEYAGLEHNAVRFQSQPQLI